MGSFGSKKFQTLFSRSKRSIMQKVARNHGSRSPLASLAMNNSDIFAIRLEPLLHIVAKGFNQNQWWRILKKIIYIFLFIHGHQKGSIQQNGQTLQK